MKAHYILLLLFLCLSCAGLRGQVTVGAHIESVKGALLDLKQEQTIGTQNSTKGMVLPRVALTDINKLYPMFAQGYNTTAEDKKHAGLIVYNTAKDATFCPGVYVWTGAEWKRLGRECE